LQQEIRVGTDNNAEANSLFSRESSMHPRPSGTVTFLFTDIEGSTKLWEQNPDAMRPALARHDQLLRQCIENSHGYVFKAVGDAFCAAFGTAPNALAGAVAAQMALAAEPWQTQTPLLVRMALHTGSAEERGGDYFGPPLNRVARLMAAGHGGQILFSLAVQELCRDVLPPEVTLRDLGERRLKDLSRPETVFQAMHPALPAEFPPLRSLDNPALPNNLPQQLTSFIGRETQAAEVKALLGKNRLLTLTGAGGSGKTRLSLQVAADLLDQYFDGVWLVELAPLSDPALAPHAVADVLGVKEQAGQTMQQSLNDALKDKRLLLVLDNCEHLIATCASLAADLLRHCPDVRILASSRELLSVTGEQMYRVPSLSLPDLKKTQTALSVSQCEAVALFADRAQSVQPSFAVTDGNASAVASVCSHLDGIPLAIELASARVRSLSVEQINTRLDQRFRLLTGGSRVALPRQQTLRALIDWSYDLLTDQEKTLLRRLSVFAGGWTLAAAEAVCVGTVIEDWEVLDLLSGLVDKSLVVYEEGTSGESRYRLLETVRQYAAERLEEHSEAEAVQNSHLSWCVALAEEAEPQLTGTEQANWLRRLETDHDNLRASLAWDERTWVQSAAGGELGLRLAGALWRFWSVWGHLSEGRQWLNRALARTGDASAGTKATAAQGKALRGAGHLARMQGDYAEAQILLEESLSIMRQLGDPWSIADTLNSLGTVAHCQGNYVAARVLYEDSLSLLRQLGDQRGITNTLNNLGRVASDQDDYTEARVLLDECLSISRQLGDQRGVTNALCNLGVIARNQGDYAGARVLQEESLRILRKLGNREDIAGDLEGMADVALEQSLPERAARLGSAAAALRERLGCPLYPLVQKEFNKLMATAAAALCQVGFAAAEASGRAMTWEQAVEYALEGNME
jgi:predicted ATPase/class 3 adenylate cyclase/Tfp pilus assembly protein PilF